jgi:anti-sigma B factor antagonist
VNDDPELSITVSDDGAAVTVRLVGELDIDTAADLRLALAGHPDRPGSRMVMDLSGLGFCDSSGLGALVSLRRRVAATGGSLDVIGAAGQVQQLFDYTGLAPLFGLAAPVGTADVAAG